MSGHEQAGYDEVMRGHAAISQASPGAAMPGAGVEQDLADVRSRWGEAYRITWENGFRATHIASGQVIDADNALDLRERIRAHFSENASG